MKTFKTIEEAIAYVKNLKGITTGDILSIKLELIKKKLAKVKGTYIFIDEFDLLA
jgi:hypothetical protein